MPRSGISKPAADPVAQASVLTGLAVLVANELRIRGEACPAAGRPATWSKVAEVLGYKCAATLSPWVTGRRNLPAASLARLQRLVAQWIEAGP